MRAPARSAAENRNGFQLSSSRQCGAQLKTGTILIEVWHKVLILLCFMGFSSFSWRSLLPFRLKSPQFQAIRNFKNHYLVQRIF